ncbi:unnamed protein product [Kuraishia capsulata CBS 1993]|uniref:Vacuolar calcium ion transporter n=1 Tax=Kuraishia capsulata CBS 1993 TaxID=1382522 RepID=W6MFW2_9ASCO|nr:uncharacterized protein KUCA_T00000263001 [Kuraishia capsulata CBS 1993]CDK24303.1 unnamed protein product [Kuraishia capsulata CBS 1993]
MTDAESQVITTAPASFLSNVSRVFFKTLYSSTVNLLLVFVPLGLLAGFLEWGSAAVFSLNFLAIVPLASILAFATEELAEHVGDAIGGLLNATFGNAVELIVSIIALQQGQITVVQASMLGSILSNLLLVLGSCFIAGGIHGDQQHFNQTVAQTMSSLLALSVIGLLLPAAFHASLPAPTKENPGSDIDGKILSFSRGTSIILLISYCLYLFFQLKTHKQLFEGINDESTETEIAISDELDPSSSNGSVHRNGSIGTDGFRQTPTLIFKKSQPAPSALSVKEATTVLILATLGVSFCADYLVGSIDAIVESSGLSKTFIGLIVIPIVGNAAEHVTAIVVAAKQKMDLAVGVAIGSSLQIALFVTPFIVLVGWAMDIPMTLYFSTYETAVMFVAVFITNYLILDGESNWLEGTMLLSTYLIIAISFFYYPDTLAQ